MADVFVSKIGDFVQVGQTVLTKITKIDQSSGKIYLSMKTSQLGPRDKVKKLEASLVEGALKDKLMLATLNRKENVEWAKKFQIGSIVNGKVSQILPHGVSVALAKNVTGLIIASELKYDVGDAIQCRVLDVDVLKRIVDLQIAKEPLKSSKNPEENTTFKGVVAINKEDYAIVTVPALGNAVAFTPARSFNSISSVAPLSKPGDIIDLSLESSQVTSLGNVYICHRSSISIEKLPPTNEAKRLIKNSVDPSISSLDDVKPGTIVNVIVQSVKKTQINIRLGDNLRGRVHISQIFESLDGIKDQKSPLKDFKSGASLQCKVIGFHLLSSHHYLPFSHKEPVSRIGLELSMKPSVLKSEAIDDGSEDLNDLLVGTQKTGFLHKIESDCLWVQLSPWILGRVDFLHVSNDLDVVSNIKKHFVEGQVVNCTVIVLDKEKRRVDLSLIPIISKADVGCQLLCRVTKVDPEYGLTVYMSSNTFGQIQLSELNDKAVSNPTQSFSAGQYLNATTVGTNSKTIELSLRKSPRDFSSFASDEIVKGFVRSISNGCFVSLGHNAIARVKISELSDLFVKDWKSLYSIGQLVKGKILDINQEKHQIEMSMRESSIDPTKKLLSFKDLTPLSLVDGVVKKIETFGLFIQIDNSNIRGLCHISEVINFFIINFR